MNYGGEMGFTRGRNGGSALVLYVRSTKFTSLEVQEVHASAKVHGPGLGCCRVLAGLATCIFAHVLGLLGCWVLGLFTLLLAVQMHCCSFTRPLTFGVALSMERTLEAKGSRPGQAGHSAVLVALGVTKTGGAASPLREGGPQKGTGHPEYP